VFQADDYRRGRKPLSPQTTRPVRRAKSEATPATDAIRFTLAGLSGLFDWRNALVIVKPDTLVRWHRKAFRLFWKRKSQPLGRPRGPARLQKLIAEMAANNSIWGEERIADELLLKIGIRISPRSASSKGWFVQWELVPPR
jgi:hypothetical protein